MTKASTKESQITGLDDDTAAAKPATAPANPADVGEIKGANFDDQLSGKFEMITIMSTPDDGGKDAVFVSLNGYAYQIPRDKPFRVPAEIAQILRDAKVTTMKPGPGGQVIEDVVQRYPFSSVPV